MSPGGPKNLEIFPKVSSSSDCQGCNRLKCCQRPNLIPWVHKGVGAQITYLIGRASDFDLHPVSGVVSLSKTLHPHA